MAILKPNRRIIRPFIKEDRSMYWFQFPSTNYIIDKRYSEDRITSSQAYYLIKNDLNKVLEYVEPCEKNEYVYSHRLYMLFLQAATEFESNCKSILKDNGYRGKPDIWNITDYWKINKHMKLSEYQVKIVNWRCNSDDNSLILQPFKSWESNYSLSWYQDYNSVKHNRQSNFDKATLRNVIESIAALYIVLRAQYGSHMSNSPIIIVAGKATEDNFNYDRDTIFGIKDPDISEWHDDEKYDFSWPILRNQDNPFQLIDWK